MKKTSIVIMFCTWLLMSLLIGTVAVCERRLKNVALGGASLVLKIVSASIPMTS